MQKIIQCFVICLCTAGMTLAQDSVKPARSTIARVPTTTAQTVTQESYVVQLSEYQTSGLGDPSQTADEIVEMLTKSGGGKHIPIETVRLSTLSGTESMVQFGKQVSVTTGKAITARGGAMRQTQTVQIGTLIRVTATPQDGKVAVKIVFESSRLGDTESDDSRPDILATEIKTTQLLEIGKPTLVGGTTSGASSFILVKVTR